MKLSTLIIGVVTATLLATLVIYSVVDRPALFTLESAGHLFLLSGLVVFLGFQERSRCYPLLVLLGTYVYQKYLLSGLYALLAASSPATADLSRFTSEHYNHYLSYAVLGVAAASFGLVAGGMPFKTGGEASVEREPRRSRIIAMIRPRRMLWYVLVIVAVEIFLKFFYGVRNPGYDDSHWTAFRIFLRGTTPRNLYILMLFYAWDEYSLSDKFLISAGIGVFLFESMILGSSRAWLYYPALLFFILKLIESGNFPIKTRHVRYFLFVVALSVVMYPLITAIRWAGYNKEFAASPDVGRVEEQMGVFAKKTDVVVSVLERLTGLREALIISNDMRVTDPGDLLSFSAMLKRLIPSFVKDMLSEYPLDVMPAQYVYDHVYEGRFIGFNAQEWGLWEYFAVSAGPWAGLGIVFLFMCAAGFLWRKIADSRSQFRPFILLVSGYFFSLFLLNYDPAYVIYSYFVEFVVMFCWLSFVGTYEVYFPRKVRAARPEFAR
jgi:hypothetical protein